MSDTLRRAVWGLILPPAQREVLLALAECAGADGDADPGVPWLAWATGYSERQVRRILKAIEGTGVIAVVGGQPRFGEALVYHIDPSRGAAKAPFAPRRRPGDAMSPDDKMSVGVGDKMSPGGETSAGEAPDKMSSPDNMTGGAHGEKPPDKMSPGDTPSAKTASISLSLQTQSVLPGDSDPERESGESKPSPEGESRARDTTPVPFHIANGLGKTGSDQPTPLIRAVEATAVYQAFVKGWDGITPVLDALAADRALDEARRLQDEINAGRLTLDEIEAVTRWKLSQPRSTTYQFFFVRGDVPGWKAWKRAQTQSRASPGEAETQDGSRYTTGKYSEFVEH